MTDKHKEQELRKGCDRESQHTHLKISRFDKLNLDAHTFILPRFSSNILKGFVATREDFKCLYPAE